MFLPKTAQSMPIVESNRNSWYRDGVPSQEFRSAGSAFFSPTTTSVITLELYRQRVVGTFHSRRTDLRYRSAKISLRCAIPCPWRSIPNSVSFVAFRQWALGFGTVSRDSTVARCNT
ncbi:hypothetical protein AArcCO_1621 [Halalkaliarchaeum sp. AArc-CO]|nr:hypothetical protein AArcCO_1621 [Halalkaliarchaeum sp. AArc-CO]